MWTVISLTGVRMKETGAGHAGRDDCLSTWAETVSTRQEGGLPHWHRLALAPKLGGSKFPLFKPPGPRSVVMVARWPAQGPV